MDLEHSRLVDCLVRSRLPQIYLGLELGTQKMTGGTR
jgi:hypothetical protein